MMTPVAVVSLMALLTAFIGCAATGVLAWATGHPTAGRILLLVGGIAALGFAVVVARS